MTLHETIQTFYSSFVAYHREFLRVLSLPTSSFLAFFMRSADKATRPANFKTKLPTNLHYDAVNSSSVFSKIGSVKRNNYRNYQRFEDDKHEFLLHVDILEAPDPTALGKEELSIIVDHNLAAHLQSQGITLLDARRDSILYSSNELGELYTLVDITAVAIYGMGARARYSIVSAPLGQKHDNFEQVIDQVNRMTSYGKPGELVTSFDIDWTALNEVDPLSLRRKIITIQNPRSLNGMIMRRIDFFRRLATLRHVKRLILFITREH